MLQIATALEPRGVDSRPTACSLYEFDTASDHTNLLKVGSVCRRLLALSHYLVTTVANFVSSQENYGEQFLIFEK